MLVIKTVLTEGGLFIGSLVSEAWANRLFCLFSTHLTFCMWLVFLGWILRRLLPISSCWSSTNSPSLSCLLDATLIPKAFLAEESSTDKPWAVPPEGQLRLELEYQRLHNQVPPRPLRCRGDYDY